MIPLSNYTQHSSCWLINIHIHNDPYNNTSYPYNNTSYPYNNKGKYNLLGALFLVSITRKRNENKTTFWFVYHWYSKDDTFEFSITSLY